ncbi:MULTISPECIES: alanine dehydrogenase [unclassified Rothia (in: high G+C Gram-positive bacteria)]|uniref:alanine dehydrogenase n=1 Tax=unclassified Rothia (in: high G+C Gram-positive bacteria) TaxID=2689056 RepID=UPI00195AF2D7|nr:MULTISPECIES: alanine dehydrogenase [unclassified Rothia (in: high G+C Gram-positive bacteria)]MBM7051643.1 alanine dehydrogenase [Rothia sp. ZJ1223]QRZ62498.1 alanine dehydrogenase [Rothia sp. ZJ932]
MRISIPREIKPREQRVGATPDGVKALVDAGHEVFVEHSAGMGAGFSDEQYTQAGAQLVSAEDAWGKAELLIKVKEPIESEYKYFREDLTLFTYLHLAAEPELTKALLEAGTRAIAYETVANGRALPLLLPMSEVAGRLAAQAAAQYLLNTEDGPGILLGGVPGVAPARVVVLGGGNVGTQAAQLVVGLGAEVTILEGYGPRVRELATQFGSTARVLTSTPANIEREIADADVIIGSVLVPGAKTPKLVRQEHLANLKPTALLIDVAIDQGGCFETSKPTTYDDPIYKVEGIRHYCVANMPGAVARTSTIALTDATLGYALKLAEGVEQALTSNDDLAKGLNTDAGKITHPGVAAAYPKLPAT